MFADAVAWGLGNDVMAAQCMGAAAAADEVAALPPPTFTPALTEALTASACAGTTYLTARAPGGPRGDDAHFLQGSFADPGWSFKSERLNKHFPGKPGVLAHGPDGYGDRLTFSDLQCGPSPLLVFTFLVSYEGMGAVDLLVNGRRVRRLDGLWDVRWSTDMDVSVTAAEGDVRRGANNVTFVLLAPGAFPEDERRRRSRGNNPYKWKLVGVKCC